VKDKYGMTALMLAARNGWAEIVQSLLMKNAKVDAKNNDGETALMLAAQNRHKKIIELLKKAGAKE